MTDAVACTDRNCEVAVVGGGILGLATAALAAQRGYHVQLFRLGNEGVPRADTLRNQGWLQSGLMYVGKLGRDRRRGRLLSNRMYNAGLTMLEGLGLPVPTGVDCGIIRVRPDTREAEHLVADAEDLGVSHLVQPLDDARARERLGPVFEEGHYYAIPDAPFPEATVLERLRDHASEAGVGFVECDSPLSLARDETSGSGHAIAVGDRRFSPAVTVLAAGAGSWALLHGLGLTPRMKLQQTPLLVVDGCHSIEAPIFVDRPRGFSFVRHPPDRATLPNGALVIGTGVVQEDVAFAPFEERRIPRARIEEFEAVLPPPLRPHVATGRFTAGYEVVPHGVKDEDGEELHYVEPWVEWVGGEEGMRLVLAMPGRATLGMWTAEQVVDRLEAQIGPPSGDARNPAVVGGWGGGIFMHFHPCYSFDDQERPKAGE